MVEPVRDPAEIADPVPVRVGEAGDVHLVDDGLAPPVGGRPGQGAAGGVEGVRDHGCLSY